MIFINLLFELFLKKNNTNKKIRYDFFNKHCFSLPNSAKDDRYIGIKQLMRNLNRLWLKRNYLIDKKNDIKSANYLYVLSPENIPKKLEFLRNIDKIKAGISRDNLFLELNFFRKIQISLLLFTLYSFVIFYVFFFKKNRINIALFPEIILQCYLLIKKLKKLKCKKLYFFYTHEPESNFISHILISKNISIIKIPNSNPLFMFNKSMIASKVILTIGYQFEEIEIFSDYNNTSVENWSSFGLNKYHNINFNNLKKNKLCFYSHASKLRKNMDHNIPSFNEIDMEIELLEYIKKNKCFSNYEITVCLHPKENESPNIKKDYMNYYKDIFGSSVKFFEKSSYDSFSKFNLGFGCFSSILFERIHCGHKTLIFNNKVDEFPLKNSKFNFFVIKDLNDLKEKIEYSLGLDCKTFFMNKTNYTYKNQSKD